MALFKFPFENEVPGGNDKKLNNFGVRKTSNSTALITPQTKFEAIIQKMWEERFEAKTNTSRQILDLGQYNFLPLAPIVMILVFLESQCREISKNVAFQKCTYFYPLLTYSF